MAEIMEENVEAAYYSITTRWSATGWEHLLISQGASQGEGVPRERVIAHIGHEHFEEASLLVAHANAHIDVQREAQEAEAKLAQDWRSAASG